MTRDARRSIGLTAWPERPTGALDRSEDLPSPFDDGGVPSLLRRLRQALDFKLGRLEWRSDIAQPSMDFRRALMGRAAGGRPRALIRVDEFPHARAFDSGGRYGTEAFKRFHGILAEAGIPYLLAVTPRVSRDYLDPGKRDSRPLDDGEVAVLRDLDEGDVTLGLHGLDHRTRHRSPRRHSEFCGLSLDEAAARVDSGLAALNGLGFEAPVFVPPFNRFDSSQYGLFAERFAVVCGGPESVRLLGFRPTPSWNGDAVYLPSYPPLYGGAAGVREEIDRMIEAEEALWAPVTLHWGWELEDDFSGLRRLCRSLSACAFDWKVFLTAVRVSRHAT